MELAVPEVMANLVEMGQVGMEVGHLEVKDKGLDKEVGKVQVQDLVAVEEH
ncbi:hypothetical protein D3C80_2151200 [compost metagenome]